MGVGECVRVSACVSKPRVFIYKLPSRRVLSPGRSWEGRQVPEAGGAMKRGEESEGGKKRKRERKKVK